MQEKNSIKGNLIKFDRWTQKSDIDEILLSRFWEEWIKDSSLDDLHDPYLLQDMDKAVTRILEAKEKWEKLIIFWDYDVDWVTSTSLLMHLFSKVWMNVSYRLPHRVNDGYGLKKYFIDEVTTLWVTLVVTVDCGTKDIDVVEHAKNLGVDVIVTDHHAVPDKISEDAIAVINPKRPDCKYPYKWLAGAGVAFKLVQAISMKLFTESEAKEYLYNSVDICAIWTVADCMEITWENRVIVKEWLKQLKNSRSLWIRKLIEDQMQNDIDADIFWFTIWPRLNAAGRMDSPYKAVNLILNNSSTVNRTLIDIEKLNMLRKSQSKMFYEDAYSKIRPSDNILVYASKDIEHGIIWIVAWRLTEQFYKPSIVLKDEWDIMVASCRSPDYFSIVDLLERHKDMFVGFWWHKQAAWFSIQKEKFQEFRQKITSDLNKEDFSQYKKQIEIDKVLQLEELGFQFLAKVNQFKPFGIGNTKPLFLVEKFQYEKLDFLWQGRDHLRFSTKHGFKIFAFFMWDYYEEIRRSKVPISIVFDISEDNWMWKKNLLLKVVDIVIHNNED
jgi:single-stranded-DNA-specific exonuclease